MPVMRPVPIPLEEMIHGVVVKDPYRWLEDRSLPDTEAWIADQQRHCKDYFGRCTNLSALQNRVRQFLDIEIVDQPTRVAGKCFYRRRNRGQEQASIYVRDELGEDRLLLDPSGVGPFVSVALQRISNDGSLLAFALKRGGGDSASIHVMDVHSGCVLDDSIHAGFARGFTFAPEVGGYYYCQDSADASEHTVRFHRFGDRQEDQAGFRIPRAPGSRLNLISDSIHLGAVVVDRCREEPSVDLWITERVSPQRWHRVLTNRRLPFHPVLNQGRILALSYEQAPSGTLPELKSGGTEVRTIFPERGAVARQLVMVGDRIFVNYQDQTSRWIGQWNFAGEDLGRVPAPGTGTMQVLANYVDTAESLFYSYESFDEPVGIFEYSIHHQAASLCHQRSKPRFSSVSTVQHRTYVSKDGAIVPVTLVTRGCSSRKRSSPVLMTSYGGFGVSMTPQFSVLVSIMMDLGCTFVLPHIRGGGEFGRSWHEAGRRRNRQSAIDDFISAGKWLVEEGITARDKLAIFGGSNAGLLVAAAMTQEPTLFRAVLAIAPLLDMVRYASFDQAVKWREEYGTVEDPTDFEVLYRYSPYHRVLPEINYPSILFVTGDQDDRCNPAHVRKMVARLQQRETQLSTVIVDYLTERGHCPTLPLSVRVEALARRLAFLCNELELPVHFGGHDEADRD